MKMENQTVWKDPGIRFNCRDTTAEISRVALIRDILHNHIYNVYNYSMEFATEIVKECDSLSIISYNPVSRTIEFKIKKSSRRNSAYHAYDYYSHIANVLKRMINTSWYTIITTAIHDSTPGVWSPEYKQKMMAFEDLRSQNQNSFMLLFNITATTSNGILLHL